MSNQKEYSRYMSNFRGVDSTSDASNVSLNRFSYLQNMYKDYRSGQGVAIETFPGTRTLCKDLGGKVYGMHTYKVTSGKVYIILHAGKKLYYFDVSERDKLSETAPAEFTDIEMKEAKSSSFVYNNRLYIIDGEHYISIYDKEAVLTAEYVNEKNAYIPTTYADGVQYEQRNMLTDKFVEKTFFEKAEKNEAYAVELNGGEWEYDDGKYGVICASIRDSYTLNLYDENVPEEYNLLNGSVWDKECYIDAERVKIDFLKVVTSVLQNSTFNGRFYDAPIIKTQTVNVAKEPANPISYTSEGTNLGMASSSGESKNFEERKKTLQKIAMTEKVEEIIGTLQGCTNLEEVIFGNNIRSLEAGFFAGIENLETVYLPAELAQLGDGAFTGCNKVTIYASSEMYNELSNNKAKYGISEGATLKKYEANEMEGSPAIAPYNNKNRIYIFSPCIEIEKVFRGDIEIDAYSGDGNKLTYDPVYHTLDGVRYIIAIELKTPEEKEINDSIFIHGKASPYTFTSVSGAILAKENKTPHNSSDPSLKGSKPNYSGSARDAVIKNTVCATFDERVFFTGNPDLPNTVFYTQRDLTGHNNPTYIGVLNWFDDGMGNTPNVAMMSNASTLMVLKGNTLQDGSIYYHVGADGGNDLTPRIYPSTEGLAGLGCVGMAVNFRDDCVFLSNQGMEAISKQAVNLERTIGHRSTNIDGLLLKCNLASARAAEWEGYLCILINGKMFLADSRQAFEGVSGAIEYEWYYITDVCGYDGDNLKYYLADYMTSDIAEFCEEKGITIGESNDRSVAYRDEDGNGENDLVKSAVSDEGIAVYYIEHDSVKYLVSSSEERENGTQDNACEICAVDDVLLLGTVGGKILCLNNDKRGTDEEEPDKSRIPVKWYNNSGHAYDAVAVLAMENAGVPHYTKTTVKRGTVLRLKAFPQSSFDVYATTDRQATTLLTSQSNSITVFGDIDFENLGLLTSDSGILAIKEKTKKWVEKQYKFESRKANRPFGLYSLTYRYIIAGDVKNK